MYPGRSPVGVTAAVTLVGELAAHGARPTFTPSSAYPLLKAAALRNAGHARPNYCVACVPGSREGCAAPLYEGYLLPFLYPTPRLSPSKPCPTRPYQFRSRGSWSAGRAAAGARGGNATRAGSPVAGTRLARTVAVRDAIDRVSGSHRRAQASGHPTQPHHLRQTRPAGARTLPARASRIGLPGRVQDRRSTAGHAWRRTYSAVYLPTCTSVQGPDVPPPPSELHGAPNHPTRTTVEAPDVPRDPPQLPARLRGQGPRGRVLGSIVRTTAHERRPHGQPLRPPHQCTPPNPPPRAPETLQAGPSCVRSAPPHHLARAGRAPKAHAGQVARLRGSAVAVRGAIVTGKACLPGCRRRGAQRPGMAEHVQCGQPPRPHVRRSAGHAPAPAAFTGFDHNPTCTSVGTPDVPPHTPGTGRLLATGGTAVRWLPSSGWARSRAVHRGCRCKGVS